MERRCSPTRGSAVGRARRTYVLQIDRAESSPRVVYCGVFCPPQHKRERERERERERALLFCQSAVDYIDRPVHTIRIK